MKRLLQKALHHLPVDFREYTNCVDVLRRAIARKGPGANPRPVLEDCAADGDLDRVYGRPRLRRALRTMPFDVRKFTDCRMVIRGALRA